MGDYSKLRTLAQRQVNPANWFQPGEEVEGIEAEDLEYIAAANPAVVLELIAEVENLGTQVRLAGVATDSAVQQAVGRAVTEQLPVIVERDQLKAEKERLQRFETAYKEFADKTDWIRPSTATQELGMHVADVIRKRYDYLTSHCQAQGDEIKALRGLLVQCALSATTLRTDGGILAEHSGFSESFVAVLRKHSAVEAGHGVGSPMYPSQRDALAQIAHAVKP